MNLKDQIYEARDILLSIFEQPKPTLGIDLDGCVDESPRFFSVLTHVWPGEVIVVTYRSDRAKAIADLEKNGIKFTDVVLVSSFDAKAEVIKERGINVYIDDQPEMLKNIPPDVSVMLFRNEGNFDFDDRKWMFSDQTGKMV
ncbi:hypothetical protein FYK55_27220 [Roseiconus nitratireducens]|uniref:Uncharacterized protein n=1 Tax=Roseiconus nitratireducens TaxID=2605748 RepID=A0A5M6CTP0_9BACT|nr:hypothetical protein [Roseiconus nitratireducens]KAA5538581.1 hypothetical protein FYK55_27220 [Roseiconus nitratireducens]